MHSHFDWSPVIEYIDVPIAPTRAKRIDIEEGLKE